jgi:3-hydroxyisobutyrate dehydrogenase
MNGSKSVQTFATVGVIGLGNMGWPMGARIVGAGMAVVGYDTDAARADQFAATTGARSVGSISELAAACTAVITMLPTSDIVERVLFDGADALAPKLRAGSVVIEMSSGVPTRTQSFAPRLAAHGVALIDAPVSGGVARARDGTLAIYRSRRADRRGAGRQGVEQPGVGGRIFNCG